MAYMYTEGKSDYIAMTPYVLITLAASGSITAGQAVAWDAGGTAAVYTPLTVVSGSTQCAGVAVATAATATPVPICVFGMMKNLTTLGSPVPGDWLTMSGSAGGFCALPTGSYMISGSAAINPKSIAGTFISGSTAFINTMK